MFSHTPTEFVKDNKKKLTRNHTKKHITKYTKFTLGEHQHNILFYTGFCEWGRFFQILLFCTLLYFIIYFIRIFQRDMTKKSLNNAENMPLWDAYSDTSFFPHLINILIFYFIYTFFFVLSSIETLKIISTFLIINLFN